MQSFHQKLYALIKSALKEDIGNGDHSTLSCIPADVMGKAILKIKQKGIIAGIEVAEQILSFNSNKVSFKSYKKDGDEINAGEIAFEVIADIHTILMCERLLLNCMQRMSGIATLTNEYVTRLKGFNTRLLDTRKTTPNFRLLEKEAVRIGGGVNHRFGLYDMIMLKDNHIDYCGGIQNAIDKAFDYVKKYNYDLKIEVEARSIADVKTIIKYGRGKVFRIMLDNFKPAEIKEALLIIGNEFETEVSGGINLENIEVYAETGVDYISAGAIIHQARSLDLSFKAVI